MIEIKEVEGQNKSGCVATVVAGGITCGGKGGGGSTE
ncbi:hypothetical protein LINGRAHAP2_LOCUS35058 [Linum grandiflorum]